MPLIFFPLEGQSVSTPASQLHLKSPSLKLTGAAEDPGLLVAVLVCVEHLCRTASRAQDGAAEAGACSESISGGQSSSVLVSRME